MKKIDISDILSTIMCTSGFFIIIHFYSWGLAIAIALIIGGSNAALIKIFKK